MIIASSNHEIMEGAKMPQPRNGKYYVQVSLCKSDYKLIQKYAIREDKTVNQYMKEVTLSHVRRKENRKR